MNNRRSHISDEEISLLLDGEINPKEEDMLRKHLANCEICANRVHQYELMFAELHSLESIPLQRDYAKVVISKIKERRSFETPKNVIKTWIPSFVFVVQIMITFGLLLFFGLKLRANFQVTIPLQIFDFLQKFSSVVFIQWGGGIDNISLFIMQFLINIRGSLRFQLPWGFVGICLSIGIIIWLVLNGVLLRHEVFDNRQKQNN
jgi:hypothetical protein